MMGREERRYAHAIAPLVLTATVLPLACGIIATREAQASSFQILEQSPANLGTAFAGTASVAEDPTTVFFNPAGMSRLEGMRLTVGLNLLLTDSEFSDSGSVAAVGTPLQQPLSGTRGETEEPGFVPNLYYVQPLGERWTFGFGINAPFGLKTEYDSDWTGRYHATASDLQLLNVNTTFAYQVTDQLSVAAGLNYQYAEATLENAIDSYGACRSGGGMNVACTLAHGGPATEASDSFLDIEGDDSDTVVDLSVHWQPTERIAFGAVWRQGAELGLDGRAEVELSGSCRQDPFCSGSLGALTGDVSAGLTLPDTLTVSASGRIAERWTLHGDVSRTGWSELQRIDIVNSSTGGTISTLELGYDDTFRYALGASFRQDELLTWRFGVALDEAPQTDAALVTPFIPDQDRVWLSAGLNYAFSRQASFDIGYAYLDIDDSRIGSVEQGHRLSGRLDNSAHVFGVQANWRF